MRLAIIVVALLAFAGGFALRFPDRGLPLALPATADPHTDRHPDTPLPVPEASSARGRVPAPDQIQGMNHHQQILWVDALPAGADLGDDEVAALLAVLRSPGVLAVVRNNIANRLIARRPIAPSLLPALAAMYRDEREDPVWRDYCIQFVAAAIPALAPAQREPAIALLREVGRSDASAIGATALLQEDRLVGEGVIAQAPDYRRELGRRLADERTPPIVCHTVLALIGQGGYREHLAAVRDQLADPANDDVKRGALFAIGRIGDGSDLPRVASHLADPNPGVVQAARSAHQRLVAGAESIEQAQP